MVQQTPVLRLHRLMQDASHAWCRLQPSGHPADPALSAPPLLTISWSKDKLQACPVQDLDLFKLNFPNILLCVQIFVHALSLRYTEFFMQVVKYDVVFPHPNYLPCGGPGWSCVVGSRRFLSFSLF